MGLLKKLLMPSPKQVLHGSVDPVGAVKNAVKSANAEGRDAPAAMANAPVDQGQPYQGDPNDPAYGSFTQPFDVEQFYKYEDPGYAFRLQQGAQAVQNGAAAGSGALSGAALKDLIGYNQDSASQEYNNSFNRYQTTQGNIFSRLMGIAQLGQNASTATGAQGTQLAGQAGQAISNAGTASGSGIVGGANALTGGATNAWIWNQYNQQQPRPVSGGQVGGV